MTAHVRIDPDTGAPEVDRYGDVVECLNDHDGGCRGEITHRGSLTGTGLAIPRCDFHWEKRLDAEEEISARYPYNPPSDWSPDDAGEHWGEEDY